MKITATIERNDNNYYQISSDAELLGNCLGGYGYSAEEAKADFLQSIEEAKEMIMEEHGKIPAEMQEIRVEYLYDLPSFFNDFDWINTTAFAKRAGINESKMRAYRSGISNASEKTLEKILATIKALGAELCAVSL